MRACVLLVLLGMPVSLAAQEARWHVAIHAVPASFGTGAEASAPAPGDVPEFGLGSGLRGALALGRAFGRWEVAIAGSYGKHGLRGGDGSSWITIEPAFTLATADLTAAYRVLGWATGTRLLVFAGPSLQFWSGEAVVERVSRLGARGGLQLVAPISRPLALDVRAGLGIAASPMTEEVLGGFDSPYDTGSLWSSELGMGLRVSF